VAKAWDFFSSPNNLNRITPDEMSFEIIDEDISPMYAGQIISYIIRPVLNIPINWVTEITHVRQDEFFVDEQRFGPYKFWHHKHFIKQVPDGVILSDLVHYAMPFGIIGRIVHKMFVRRKLEKIFDYRVEIIKKLFNSGIVE
jgi:ligand-binding SRPBCC domain-containing protein